MSGIRVETLRAWDNRGQLEPVQRVGNTRYYTSAQVERMKSLNTLIQSGAGYAIGDLCVKSDDELQALVSDLYTTSELPPAPEIRRSSSAVVVGWRLMQLRDPSIENDDVRTVAPNIDDVEAFYDYLRRLDHDGLKMAVVELPSIWNVNYIKELRKKIDSLNQSDCHVIAVSFMNDPETFENDRDDAKQIGVSLLDGAALTWPKVLDEINSTLVIRNEVIGEATVKVSAAELARLASSDERVAGIAVAEIAGLYQKMADITGLAKREADRTAISHQDSANLLTHHLQAVFTELEACLDVVRTTPKASTSNVPLDKAEQ